MSKIESNSDYDSDTDSPNMGSKDKKYKKEKSLGVLCKQFIGLFVNWKRVISLEEAARQISKKDIEEQKLKTKIRRLYDIANVL
jgi:transcription factor E2F7/8